MLEDVTIDANAEEAQSARDSVELQYEALKKRRISKSELRICRTKPTKPKFGLPEGFIPRLHRYGRSVLLEDDVYRLPNGQELIPQQPSGTLGRLRHLYALLTVEQYEGAKRGSVYVRTDGKIFDYSFDHADPLREIFDTGYTIYHLERTGRHVTRRCPNRTQSAERKYRRAAHAS